MEVSEEQISHGVQGAAAFQLLYCKSWVASISFVHLQGSNAWRRVRVCAMEFLAQCFFHRVIPRTRPR